MSQNESAQQPLPPVSGYADPISQQNAVRDMLAWGDAMQRQREIQEEHDRKAIAEVMRRHNSEVRHGDHDHRINPQT